MWNVDDEHLLRQRRLHMETGHEPKGIDAEQNSMF